MLVATQDVPPVNDMPFSASFQQLFRSTGVLRKGVVGIRRDSSSLEADQKI